MEGPNKDKTQKNQMLARTTVSYQAWQAADAIAVKHFSEFLVFAE